MKSGLRLLAISGLGLGFLFAGAGTAQAIIIADAGGGAPLNNAAPLDDPGWDRVGSFSNGSGVYLGNGWVLTAAHVTTSGATFTLNGNTYDYVPGSGHILNNPSGEGLTAQTDLWMGQYVPAVASPAFPAGVLTISSTTPAVNTVGTMIGWGKIQTAQTETTFYVDTTPAPWQWGTSYFVGANTTKPGFYWSSTRQQRWAQSPVVLANGNLLNDFSILGKDVRGFATGFFDELNGGNVADNDSGSPLFIKTNGVWELAGIAHALLPFSGQNMDDAPKSTVVYGNGSFYSDLSLYADQINAYMTVIPEPSSLTLLTAAAAGLLVRRRRRTA